MSSRRRDCGRAGIGGRGWMAGLMAALAAGPMALGQVVPPAPPAPPPTPITPPKPVPGQPAAPTPPTAPARPAQPSQPSQPAEPSQPEQPAAIAAPNAARSVDIAFDARIFPKPYSGRVYLVFGRGNREPRTQIGNWFRPTPTYSMDVKDIPAGGVVMLDEKAMGHPMGLASTPAGEYQVQAMARVSQDYPIPGRSPGDLYSLPVKVTVGPEGIRTAADAAKGIQAGQPVRLLLNQIAVIRPFEETDRIKFFEINSPSLSAFLGRPAQLRAAVVLPVGWEKTSGRTWPAVYSISGFGGSHFDVFTADRRSGPNASPLRDNVLRIFLDATNYWGHSVFADSANTGPWGTALVSELIPEVEKAFMGPAADAKDANPGLRRVVTGVSSGGWSSLWLQITYPEVFNGCFSHVPDPVDFRDFQQINIYREGENMFRTPDGRRRPLARQILPNGVEAVVIQYDNFVAMESVLGPGGQIRSFEAVFSPRGEDGLPKRLFDPVTGVIDPQVAKAWENYDIRLVLERNWARLEPKLRGKIHVWAGSQDSFYLHGAVALLKESLAGLKSDAVVEVVNGLGHALYPPGEQMMYQRLARIEKAAGRPWNDNPAPPAAPAAPAAPGAAPSPAPAPAQPTLTPAGPR